MKGFNDEQTKQLIYDCIEAQQQGASLQSVFERTAIKTKRSRGTVRNFYYSMLRDIDKGQFKCELPQGVEKLKPKRAEAFSSSAADELFDKITAAKRGGQSVRAAILDMSKGDARLALRYQNKYRSMLKREKQIELDKIKVNGEDFKYFNKLSSEIDALVERIKDKYCKECVKLKEENQRLLNKIKQLQKAQPKSQAIDYFAGEGADSTNKSIT